MQPAAQLMPGTLGSSKLCTVGFSLPCLGPGFMPLVGSFARKVSPPSVSPEHSGEARTDPCMGFVGSGLTRPRGHHRAGGQDCAGDPWPCPQDPGRLRRPTCPELHSHARGAQTVRPVCAHTGSPCRSPARGPRGTAARPPGASSAEPPAPPPARAAGPGFLPPSSLLPSRVG